MLRYFRFLFLRAVLPQEGYSLNFVNLKYFLTAAEELNMTKAAQKLYISPQSLSNHIARLEQELNIQLFERTPKLRLTYAGECTAKIAAQMLKLNKQMQVQINDIINQRRGNLNIGLVTRTRGRILLPRILPAYHRMNPDVELHLEVGSSDVLAEKLKEGILDLIFTMKQDVGNSNICALEVYRENFCLIASECTMRQLFPDNTKTVVRAFEKGVDLSAFRTASFLMMEPGTPIRKQADQLFLSADWEPKIILESTDLETLLALCYAGMGVTFAHERTALHSFAKNLAGGTSAVHVFPIMDEAFTGCTFLCYRRSEYLSKALREFITLTMETFQRPKPFFEPLIAGGGDYNAL